MQHLVTSMLTVNMQLVETTNKVLECQKKSKRATSARCVHISLLEAFSFCQGGCFWQHVSVHRPPTVCYVSPGDFSESCCLVSPDCISPQFVLEVLHCMLRLCEPFRLLLVIFGTGKIIRHSYTQGKIILVHLESE